MHSFIPKLAVLLFFISIITNVAADSILLSGAGSTPTTSYYYVGYVAPVGKSNLGNGYVHRFWVDYLTYSYESNLGTINAQAPGLSYSIGYQISDENFSGGVFLGIDSRRTTLSPDDIENTSRDQQLNSLLAIEGAARTKYLTTFVNASYLADAKAYWSRIRFLTDDVIKLGPEFSWQGDPFYHEKKIGIYFGDIKISNELKIGANLGKSYTPSGNDFYIGFELTKLLK